MTEHEETPSYWSVLGLVLWSIAILFLAAEVVDLVGHFILRKW